MWRGDGYREASLHWPFQNSHEMTRSPLTIKYREFIKDDKQVLSEPWTLPSGVNIMVSSAPFACVSPAECRSERRGTDIWLSG